MATFVSGRASVLTSAAQKAWYLRSFVIRKELNQSPSILKLLVANHQNKKSPTLLQAARGVGVLT